MHITIGSSHLTAAALDKFRRDWIHSTPGAITLQSLQNMDVVVTATDEQSDEIMGFICGFTDRTLVGYVWDLEVLHAADGEEIVGPLIEAFVAECGEIYQINAHPRLELAVAFEAAGFKSYPTREAIPMTIQNFAKQAG